MAFKLIALSAIVAVASAGVLPVSYESHHEPISSHHYEPATSSAEFILSHDEPTHHKELSHLDLSHLDLSSHELSQHDLSNLDLSHHEPITHQEIIHHEPITHQEISHHEPITHQEISHHEPIISHHVPITKHVVALHKEHHEEEHHSHPKYKFSYDVKDHKTGDIKSQKEERDGDVVRGEYSLVEPDGSKRTVKYSADKHSGFNAVVHREPSKHPVKVVAVKHAPSISLHSHQDYSGLYH